MSEQEPERKTADKFIDGTELIPHPTKGMVPLYEGHPPDTPLPIWRCPHCGESGVSMKDLWKAYKRRDRLVFEREAYDYDDPEWSDLNEGVHEMRREIDRLLWALPPNVSSWVSDETRPRFWEDSELNPDNYRTEER